MADDRLPAHPEPGGRHLTSRPPGGGDAPLHSARELLFNYTALPREELWEQLSEAVRQRVRERVGETIEWWAACYEERVSAAVLGTRALIVLQPTVNAAGKPATEMSTVALDETSFRSVRVTGGPTAVGGGSTALTQARAPQQHQRAQQLPSQPPRQSQPASPSQPARPHAHQHQLSVEMSGFLGQLPPRAQQLLQDPFASPVGGLRYDFYYYLMHHGGHGLGASGALHVWCYLADNRTVTFCAGVGHGYRNPGGATSWDLTCWRAAVAAKPRP